MNSEHDLTKFLDQIQPLSLADRVLGCIFGQVIGDSLGSYLEFQREIKTQELKRALEMPGGGPFALAPGQITDDSELAMELMDALLQMQEGAFDVDKIAKNYHRWVHSRPFDIGITTRQALNNKDVPDGKYAKLQTQNSIWYNQQSMSNGCIMRISPLAIYAALNNLPRDKLIEYTTLDVALTHSNKTAQGLSCIWVYIMQQIILLPPIVDTDAQIKQILEECQSHWSDSVYKEAMNPTKERSFTELMGFMLIPFEHGIQSLKNKPSSIRFRDQMEYILSKGGDTDTNGCIVGALIGALVGFKSIEQQNKNWIETILNCKPKRNREFYKPQKLIGYTIQLYERIQSKKQEEQIQQQQTLD